MTFSRMEAAMEDAFVEWVKSTSLQENERLILSP
jgi:hypothetical protein